MIGEIVFSLIVLLFAFLIFYFTCYILVKMDEVFSDKEEENDL